VCVWEYKRFKVKSVAMSPANSPFFLFFVDFSAGLGMSDCRVLLRFKTYEEFWCYCFGQCRDYRVGCAVDCELRKRFGIPPHGKSYESKLKGEVQPA